VSDRGADQAACGLPDPMQFWRQFYQQSEQTWGKLLEQQQGSEAYAAMIGQTLDTYASFHRALRDNMNRYLETMNLPSRDDFARLASQVVALEAKIDAVDEKIDDLQDRLGNRDRQADSLRDRLRSYEALLDDLRRVLEVRDQRIEAVLARLESADGASDRPANRPRSRQADTSAKKG
jgi:polyhydroxyalkanoic acid synthase PhaR subunit